MRLNGSLETILPKHYCSLHPKSDIGTARPAIFEGRMVINGEQHVGAYEFKDLVFAIEQQLQSPRKCAS